MSKLVQWILLVITYQGLASTYYNIYLFVDYYIVDSDSTVVQILGPKKRVIVCNNERSKEKKKEKKKKKKKFWLIYLVKQSENDVKRK